MKHTSIWATIALLSTMMWACGEQTDSTPVITNVVSSGCHTDYTEVQTAKNVIDPIIVTWPSDEGPMQVTHYNLLLDCGSENGFVTTIEQNGDTVIVVEHLGMQGITDCLCLYDNSFQIENLPPRPFTLVIQVETLYLGTPNRFQVYSQLFS